MRIKTIRLHNFRSIDEATLVLSDYTLLVGQNNVGKTSILTALRVFYEHEGAKYTKAQDWPKFGPGDDESWLEIHFLTSDQEQEDLKAEYRSDDGLLRVRRYFQSEDRVKSGQSNIYGYENGELSSNLFYGAKNISQAKLGQVVYIPEVAKTAESLKVSGPSPFRDMLSFVMKRAVQASATFETLGKAFDTFNREFGEESSKDGFSVNLLVDEINAEIEHWRIRFGIEINPIRPEDIIKNLVEHYIQDDNLQGQRVGLDAFGQGLQRHLIYTLLMLSPRYGETRRSERKEFAPDFTLLLFEEPEAFLHPSQQDRLNSSLRGLSREPGQQVVATTHSPQFVSRNISDLGCLIRLHKPECITRCHQLCDTDVDALMDSNLGLHGCFQELAEDDSQPLELREKIRNRILDPDYSEERRLEDESIRYILWLTPDRASLFFADHVVICEGMSEKALLDYLAEERWAEPILRRVSFVDALGNYNIHRCIALLHKLGIQHSVIMDQEKDADIHGIIRSFIADHKSDLTTDVHVLSPDLEGFLGIQVPKKRRTAGLKPLNVLSAVMSDSVPDDKLDELKKIVMGLVRLAV
jgi:putative ATP-dependent endonuclease of OLD family